MDITLRRFAYTPTETEGVLSFAGEIAYTVERPWIKTTHPGGRAFLSCVPDGQYDLHPFIRDSGERVFALYNPDLGVYLRADDRPPRGGRFAILIHAGNYVTDVAGCIAPGARRTIYDNKLMVTNSRATLQRIHHALSFDESHRLTIEPALGATDH